jgi:aminopeptidase YwaD
MNLLTGLGGEIGVRQAGSPASAAAAVMIAGSLAELGLEPQLQEFEFVGYDPLDPVLEVGGERIDAGPCMYAGSTPPGGVEGTIAYIGKLVVRAGMFETSMFAVVDGAGRELARIYVNGRGPAIPLLPIFPPNLGGPATWVSAADGARLADLVGAPARLRSGGELRPGLRDANVIAELAGASPEAVVVCAHFDSVWRGPGAIDNATGVEGVRRLAERFSATPQPRSLIFIAFAAEEIGLLGATHYVREAEVRGELERIVGVVNLDCIACGSLFEVMTGPEEWERRVAGFIDELGIRDRYDVHVGPPLPGSDHLPFWQAGVPATAITYHPYPEYHTPEDTLALVDEQRLEDAVDLAERLVSALLRSARA